MVFVQQNDIAKYEDRCEGLTSGFSTVENHHSPTRRRNYSLLPPNQQGFTIPRYLIFSILQYLSVFD